MPEEEVQLAVGEPMAKVSPLSSRTLRKHLLAGLRSQSARDFSDSLAAELGVLLLPGTGLGSDDRHVRFGFGRRNFRDGLERLDRYLAT